LCGEFGRLEFEINFTYWETAHTIYSMYGYVSCIKTNPKGTGYDVKIYLSGPRVVARS